MSEDNAGSPEDELDLTVACRDCRGTGQLEGSFCPTCAGTGRVVPALWRDPADFASLHDWGLSSWPMIILGIEQVGLDTDPDQKDGAGVHIRHIAALLRRGEPVPVGAQRFLADLIENLSKPRPKKDRSGTEGKRRKRGRPKGKPLRNEFDRNRRAIALVEEIAAIQHRLASSGRPATLKDAYAEYKKVRRRNAERRHGKAKKVVEQLKGEYKKHLTEAASVLGVTEEKLLSVLSRHFPAASTEN